MPWLLMTSHRLIYPTDSKADVLCLNMSAQLLTGRCSSAWCCRHILLMPCSSSSLRRSRLFVCDTLSQKCCIPVYILPDELCEDVPGENRVAHAVRAVRRWSIQFGRGGAQAYIESLERETNEYLQQRYQEGKDAVALMERARRAPDPAWDAANTARTKTASGGLWPFGGGGSGGKKSRQASSLIYRDTHAYHDSLLASLCHITSADAICATGARILPSQGGQSSKEQRPGVVGAELVRLVCYDVTCRKTGWHLTKGHWQRAAVHIYMGSAEQQFCVHAPGGGGGGGPGAWSGSILVGATLQLN